RVSLKALTRRRRREEIEARAGEKREPASDLSWREACAVLHEELDKLPDTYRLPLMLCYLDGLSRDEAARRLGRNLNSIKKALETGCGGGWGRGASPCRRGGWRRAGWARRRDRRSDAADEPG